MNQGEKTKKDKALLLSDTLRLDYDGCCMWISRKIVYSGKTKNEHKERWERLTGYHETFDQLIKSFAAHSFRNITAGTPEGYLDEMRKIEQSCHEIADKLKGLALDRTKAV